MIVLAVLYWFIYQPEFGRLRLDFNSRKYWYKFNELVLKPFFILSLLIIGISTVVDKKSINRAVRITMISLFSISVIICISVYSSLNLVLSLVFAITGDRKSTRLNSSHVRISYAVFCLKKKKKNNTISSKHII